MTRQSTIFKKSSITYYFSSLFFPKRVQNEISVLYAFVRTADDFVDSVPAKRSALIKFVKEYEQSRKGTKVPNEIVSSFTKLEKDKRFNPEWTEYFLRSMALDLKKKTYADINELEEYMYGSAEVIGLYLASILSLPKESLPYARKLGKAMQYLNFIRDIREDNSLGRTYIPQSTLNHFGLRGLQLRDIKGLEDKFSSMIRSEIERYYEWDNEARKGFRYIPRKYRIAIRTAADSYRWTAKKIFENPMIVYERKVKPTPRQVLLRGVFNFFK